MQIVHIPGPHSKSKSTTYTGWFVLFQLLLFFVVHSACAVVLFPILFVRSSVRPIIRPSVHLVSCLRRILYFVMCPVAIYYYFVWRERCIRFFLLFYFFIFFFVAKMSDGRSGGVTKNKRNMGFFVQGWVTTIGSLERVPME